MKKIYSVLAAAIAVSLSASANYTLPQTTKVSSATAEKSELVKVATDAPEMNKMRKSAAPVDWIYGTYFIQCRHALTSNGQPTPKSRASIVISPSTNPGYVTVRGLCFGIPAEFKYDETTGEIIIPNNYKLATVRFQDIGAADVIITTNRWNLGYDESGDEILTDPYEVDECRMAFGQRLSSSDGTEYQNCIVDANDLDLMFIEIVQDGAVKGYWARNLGFQNLWVPNYQRYQNNDAMKEALGGTCEFNYKASEWREVEGKASFSDGWLMGFVNQVPAAYEVPVLRNLNNPNIVMLQNPYGNSADYMKMFNENDITVDPEGAILLDLTDKTLPVVVPFVPSGIDLGLDGVIYCNSVAGDYKFFQEVPAGEIAESMEADMFDVPTMDENYICTIPNCRVSFTYDIPSIQQWTDQNENAIDMFAQITLPEDAVVGVEGIVNDADVNAPVRYFNLQGVEVTAPAKGEVVVKKQGSKATKVVF